MFNRGKGRAGRLEQPSIQQLAKNLGIERRLSPRVRYPLTILELLPSIHSAEVSLTVQDLSMGGCCLIDPKEVLGPSIGNEIHLQVRWENQFVDVNARVVSRVDHRRHIQFLNLSEGWQKRIRSAIEPGVRGASLRKALDTTTLGPTLDAKEVWSAATEDCLILCNDVHRRASFNVCGNGYNLFYEAWPTNKDGQSINRGEFEGLLLFLVNVAQPTQLIKELIQDLTRMHQERFG